MVKTNRRRSSFVDIARESNNDKMLLFASSSIVLYPVSEKYEWIARIKADDAVDIN